MLPVVAGAAVFLAATLALLGLIGSRGALAETDRRVLSLARQKTSQGSGVGAMFRRPPSSLPFLARFLAQSPWSKETARKLEQAGVRLRVGEYLMLRVVLAVVGFTPLALLLPAPANLLIGLVAGAIGFLLPALYVRMRRERRIEAIDKQLPELLTLLANSLRAGFAFLQSVETASRQLGPPISDDLQIMLADTALGASTEDALRDLGGRTGSYELEMVITAILVQRTTGGNLSELLENVAETMRDREQVRGDIRVFTAQQRLTGNILAVYPVILALIMFAMNPAVWSTLVTTHIGQVLLAIGAALQVLGFFLIRRILDMDY